MKNVAELQFLTQSNWCAWHLLPYPVQRHLNILSTAPLGRPCPLMLMMWLLLTRSTWLSSLITTSLSQDSYLNQPCLIVRPTFPHHHHPSNATSPDAPPSYSPAPLQSFSLQAVTESEVLKKHLKLDPQKNIWVR